MQKTVVIPLNPYLGEKEVHAFSNGIILKMNAIAELGLELAYHNVTVQHISHSAIEIFLNSIITDNLFKV